MSSPLKAVKETPVEEVKKLEVKPHKCSHSWKFYCFCAVTLITILINVFILTKKASNSLDSNYRKIFSIGFDTFFLAGAIGVFYFVLNYNGKRTSSSQTGIDGAIEYVKSHEIVDSQYLRQRFSLESDAEWKEVSFLF